MNKTFLRNTLRQKRRSLSHFKRTRSALSLAKQLQLSGLFEKGRHIAFYFANDGEINPDQAIKFARKIGVKTYLPEVNKNNLLEFRHNSFACKLKQNHYNISEPLTNSIVSEKLNAICIPLVAFDNQGNRLGMGGGYYDRLMQPLYAKTSRPLFIGLAYDFQEVNVLPTDTWDRPLDIIVTETRVLLC